MTNFQVFFGFLARFRLVFGYVDPGAERPRQPLFRLFSEFSKEKAFDPCRWPTISQNLKGFLVCPEPETGTVETIFAGEMKVSTSTVAALFSILWP